MPTSTLKDWVSSRTLETSRGLTRTEPVISAPPGGPRLLSFLNLAEAHMLAAIRRTHGVPMQKVRKVARMVERELGSPHPLIDARFQTDGINLFVDTYGALVDHNGQCAIKGVLEASLSRIEWDGERLAARLFPFLRGYDASEPKAVVIDPRKAFGCPVIAGTAIPTAVIAGRVRAGDRPEDVARDYGLSALQIEDAIRCELRAPA